MAPPRCPPESLCGDDGVGGYFHHPVCPLQPEPRHAGLHQYHHVDNTHPADTGVPRQPAPEGATLQPPGEPGALIWATTHLQQKVRPLQFSKKYINLEEI